MAVIWARRKSLMATARSAYWWGLPLIVIVQAVGIVGILYKYDSIDRYSLLLTPVAAGLFLFGASVMRMLKWVVVFALMAAPLPGQVQEVLSLPLQSIATKSAAFGLECMGYFVVREGNVLRLDDHATIGVAE